MSSTAGFRVAAGSSEGEHRVRGSRFVAVASPASDLDEAAAAREAQRSRFHDQLLRILARNQQGSRRRQEAPPQDVPLL